MPIEYGIKALPGFTSFQEIQNPSGLYSRLGEFLKYRERKKNAFVGYHCFPNFSPPKNGVVR
jgi:hypothetical protein